MGDCLNTGTLPDVESKTVDQKLEELLAAPIACSAPPAPWRMDGVRIGTLVGFADGGATPLVVYPDQPTAEAQRARATLDLHAAHIGKQAVLMFEEGDAQRPIIVGCLHEASASPRAESSADVQVEADGQRVILSARNQIVLRCGKASITLTKEGKILLQGAYVSNQSSGVLRIKGSSVQIN